MTSGPRRISLPTHALFELLGGVVLLGAPLLLGFGAAGTVVAFGLGVLAVGLSLAGAEDLPVASHVAMDQALVMTFLASAVALALAGDGVAAVVFLAVGTGQLALTLTTRYVRPLAPARF